MGKEIIKLDHIDVVFKQKKQDIKAVEDVTIHINQGDIYGIVGYSGAGKSTLVRVINLLQVPSAGKITVDDTVFYDHHQVQLTAAQLRQKRKDIGMIFQHFNLMAQMTAKENVAFALKHSPLSAAEKEKKVHTLLDLVGLADRADNYPAQLSGGQKQRMSIARGVVNNPNILILDDSTSALDAKSEKLVQEALNKELQGTTTIIIAQKISSVVHADKILVLDQGRLIGQGTHAELVATNDVYREIYETQKGKED